MNSPPPDHKAWVQRFSALIGSEFRVTQFHDDDGTHSIPIVRCDAGSGMVAATIGLMEINQSQNPNVEIPSEVIIDVRHYRPEVENVLATIAFFVMKDGWRLRPGAVFRDIVRMYLPETPLPHIYLTAPFQWDDGASRVELPTRVIFPLLALPISESEGKLVREAGGEALEAKWQHAATDVLDWSRGSAV